MLRLVGRGSSVTSSGKKAVAINKKERQSWSLLGVQSWMSKEAARRRNSSPAGP